MGGGEGQGILVGSSREAAKRGNGAEGNPQIDTPLLNFELVTIPHRDLVPLPSPLFHSRPGVCGVIASRCPTR